MILLWLYYWAFLLLVTFLADELSSEDYKDMAKPDSYSYYSSSKSFRLFLLFLVLDLDILLISIVLAMSSLASMICYFVMDY
jgi:hypothetical protein